MRILQTVSPHQFRAVLGHFPTGVVIVTGMTADGPVGFSLGAFTSLSLEPPQVLLCPGRQSTSWPRIEAAGRLCLNVLAADQEDLCRLFATTAPAKFAGVEWRPSRNGSPLIDGVLASIDCDIASVVPAGDHYVAIGAVTHLEVHRSDRALVFFRGRYCSASA
jgi:3-hydroxy-9,10-secoandrosta-1,3,5(10)-triene-9,17-dione monooxygenase reductase component